MTTSATASGKGLFADWRYDAAGQPQSRLRAEPARGAGAERARGRPQLRLRLVARARACGRSRPTASAAVVSPAFADIFRANALKNGLLPVQLDEATHAALAASPGLP